MKCMIHRDGTRKWYQSHILHRIGGPSFIGRISVRWYQHGKLHREDGPAVEWVSAIKEWWKNGQRHREDGPAVEWANGRKEYWIGGRIYTQSDWRKYYGMYDSQRR